MNHGQDELGEVVLEEPNTMESMQTFENIINTITDMLNIRCCFSINWCNIRINIKIIN